MAREYPISLRFEKGLRPESFIRSANLGYLKTLKNLKVGIGGLREVDPFVNPITGFTPTLAWPHPQLTELGFEGGLLGADYVRTVNKSTGGTGLVSVFTWGASATPFTIPSGGTWHAVPLGSNGTEYFLTNGACMVFDISGNASGKCLGTTDVIPKALALNKADGRLFAGGLTFTTPPAVAYLNTWRANVPADIIRGSELAAVDFGDGNMVLWSEPGGGASDQPYQKFILFLGSQGTTDAAVLTQLERKAMGITRLNTTGTIQVLKNIGNRIIAYTNRDVWDVRQGEDGYYRATLLLNMGVSGRGCVGGDEGTHVFVTEDGTLYRLSENGTLSKLGFEEYLSTLTLADVVVSFDPYWREFYISDGAKCYLLMQDELAEVTIWPTSVVRWNGDLCAISGGSGHTAFELETLDIDYAFRGHKDVTFMEVEGYGLNPLQARISFRYDNTSSFVVGPWTYGSPDGVFYLGRRCVEHSVGLKGTVQSGGKLESSRVRFQWADSRTIRGPRGAEAESSETAG